MRSSRGGYLVAMMAGLAIVGASTGGVLAATSHHQQSLATSDEAAANPTPSLETSPVETSPVETPEKAAPDPVAAASAAQTPSESGSAAVTGTSSAAPTAVISAQSTAPAPHKAADHLFKDGRYSATGSYNSPGGIEKLGVTLTLAGDKVTKSELNLLGGAGLSHSFQSAFASGYSTQVIGKDIASISLGAVSGSSLTGLGFNAALKTIESDARVQK